MSEKEFQEIKKLLEGILKCKTQAHRANAVNMIIYVLAEKVKKAQS